MPNHISHIVTIEGDSKSLLTLKKKLKVKKNDFDFNGVIPTPKELKNHSSPVTIITDEEYQIQEAKKKEIQKRVDNLEWVHASERYILTYDGGITKEIRNKLLKKFGVDNWYDWSIKNWGTKWGAYEVVIIDNGDNFLQVTFNTAWSTPKDLFLKLSEQYPTLEIKVKYADEDFSYNVGEYNIIGGHIVKYNIPKGGTPEAIKLAVEILKSEEYYYFDIFNDYCSVSDFGSVESLNNLISVLINENRFITGLPDWVLEHTKQMLLDNEDYETLEKIKEAFN